jgi:DNA-binding NtrC family response regulator
VTLPPLRDRPEDIPLLAEHFIAQYNKEFRQEVVGFDKAAMAVMQAYHWPGNVRELRNLVERAMLMARGGLLTLADLTSLLKTPAAAAQDLVDLIALGPGGIDVEEVVRLLVGKALAQTGGNQSRAAALLRMTRDQLRYRVQKYGLNARKDGPDR